MPEEPDIEKTLRASAKRRREEGGAAPELHPATRRLFQDEIARLHRTHRSAAGFRLNWLWASPARLAMSLACLVALIFLGSLLIPRHAPKTAKSSGAPIELATANAPLRERIESTPAPAPVQAPGPGNAGDSNAVQSVGPLVVQSAPAPTPPGPAPQGRFSTSPTPASRAGGFGLSDPTAYKDAASVASNALALDTVNQSPATNLIRRFTRLNALPPLETLAVSTNPSLFRSLRVEQNGDQLSVIDENDGSVYTGLFTNAVPIAAITPPPATNPATSTSGVGVLSSDGLAAGTNAVPVPNYSFSVSGTNRTLNQLVVLTGTVGPNNGRGFGRGGANRGGTFGGAQIGGFGGGGGGGAGAGRGAAPGGPGGGFGGNPGGAAGGGPGAAGGVAPTATGNSTNLTATGGRLIRGGRAGVAPAFQLRGTVTLGTNQFPINAAPIAPN